MPNPISAVACADSYTDAATIGPLTMGSNGGYFTIATNDVFMQLGYKEQGRGVSEIRWMDEAHVPVGNGVFFKGTYAARFRNFAAGSVATVSGGLATPTQPLFTIAAGGVAGRNSGMVTGIIPAAGTTPTGGTGFTYTHTNGTGIYVITFTTVLAALPTITLALNTANARLISYKSPSAAGFTVQITGTGGSAQDEAFSFVATATV